MSLKNKVALVTGAARGIGRATVEKLARDEAEVVAGDISEEVKDTAAELKDSGLQVGYRRFNVAVQAEVRAAIEDIIGHYGRLDILVNNAGIAQFITFEELTERDWDRVMDVNLKGVFFCSQAVLPQMKKQRSGKIINLASLGGKTGGLKVGANYSASKAGVEALTKSVAKAAAPYGINVNAVSPGYIATDMTKDSSYDPDTVPLKRLGQPEDVADVIHFLASDASRYLAGEIVDVDGGVLMD